MSPGSHRAWATIDLDALRQNLARVQALCPDSSIYPVIKSNAYGHGMAQVVAALQQDRTAVAGCAVATVEEALDLRKQAPQLPVLLLNGFITMEELRQCLQHRIEAVVHSDYQVEMIEQLFHHAVPTEPVKFWIKYNTGMNRLGMERSRSRESWLKVCSLPMAEPVLMSHLACADQPDHQASVEFTRHQLAELLALRDDLSTADRAGSRPPCSLAASAGILQWPETHLDIVRPGIMLYGSSPLTEQTGADLGLHPVMTLSSRIITIRTLQAGDSIGYGATHVCDRQTRMGIASIGYGDGYPRSAASGTPVVVKTASGSTRSRLLGRVSMDTIAIDLSGINEVQVNDEVVLWGADPEIDEVARSSNTIAYELFCKLTSRVPFCYRHET